MTKKDKNKENAAIMLLQNNQSWESIHACIQLDVFSHIDWSKKSSLIVKLADKVQERSNQDRNAAALFWGTLRSQNVPADLMIGKTPLWMQFLFGNCVHVFKAMMEKNDVLSQDLNVLTTSHAFKLCVLQDDQWSVLSQISSPSFAPIKHWAEEYRKNNLWMLSTSSKQLYNARPDFADNGIPSEEIKRWALSWIQQPRSSAKRVHISSLLFQENNGVRWANQLNPAERKDVVEALTVETWKELSVISNKSKSNWLDDTECDVSFSALKTAFSAWSSVERSEYTRTHEKEDVQSFMRAYLKRMAQHWLKNHSEHQQEVFKNFLSLWDGVPIQPEEVQILNDFMKENSQLGAPWNWPQTNPSHMVLAVGAFIASATDEEIQYHSRDLCNFTLHALQHTTHNEKVSGVLTEMMFEGLKQRDAESVVRPHLAQILWMSTFMSQPRALLRRCIRWNGMKKAQEHRANLKLFYPPVYEDLISECFKKMQLCKLKPDERAVVEKTCLEYNMIGVVKDPTVKTVRKM